MMKILGKCSNCGGNVMEPNIVHSTVPIPPKCDGCGNVPESYMKIIKTVPEKKNDDTNKTFLQE